MLAQGWVLRMGPFLTVLQLRCLFYMSHVATEGKEAPLRGYVILYNARVGAQWRAMYQWDLHSTSILTGCSLAQGFDLYRHFDRILMKKVAKLPTGMPMSFRGSHVITGSGKSVVSLILPIMKQM